MKYLTVLLAYILIFTGCGSSDNSDKEDSENEWIESVDNPVLESGWATWYDDLLINDPCVIKEGDTYRMWFSKGPGVGINHVKIYEGTSTDGLNWNQDTTPLLGPDSDAEATGTTTPVVTGTYSLTSEELASFINDRPVFELSAGGWYLWYDADEENYRISAAAGNAGTESWLGNGGTKVDGTYTAQGTASGTVTMTSDWDSEKVETPMVIKVGSTYHLYYSGFKIGDNPGSYQVGHATSSDGTTWTKDPNNPVIAYHANPLEWGYYQAAEPGVIYNTADSKFYLYYTSAIYRGAEYNGLDTALKQGICLATSSDGSVFTFEQLALEQSANYPVDKNYVGYSTPYALIDSEGTFHLFYDAAAYVSSGEWRQVALAHAESSDGKSFTESEHDIFTYNQGDWKDYEVRAPSVIEEDGYFKMWFAGNNSLLFVDGFIFGIGFASKELE